MNILAIETSCDETSVAVVKNGTEILSLVTSSSENLHKKTGGIIPESAARKQLEYILPVINQALTTAFPKRTLDIYHLSLAIDAIAVTYGPGLIGSLLVGLETARTLSYLWNIPIIPVNHLLAHLYANWITDSKNLKLKIKNLSQPTLPAIGLVASGGHTDLVLMKSHTNIKYLGGTRDDAAGEAFDKTARLLGLPYPGGPSISNAASQLPITDYQLLNLFPRPLISSKDFDFSFSGLKTSVLNYLKKNHITNHQSPITNHLAAEVQASITDVLVSKTLSAAQKFNIKSIIIGGGVTANQLLKQKFIDQISKRRMRMGLHVPPAALTTDNAAMIGACAYYHHNKIHWPSLSINPELSIKD